MLDLFYWQMNVFMLREILYRETYDKSPSVYTEIRERGEGERNPRKRWVRKSAKLRAGEAQLGRRFWTSQELVFTSQAVEWRDCDVTAEQVYNTVE